VKGKIAHLKCLTLAAAIALLAIFPLQAGAANSPHRPARAPLASEHRWVTAPQRLVPNPVRPGGSGKSYFWEEAGTAAAVFAGLLALGLGGDRAVSGLIYAIQVLCVGAARAVRPHRTPSSEVISVDRHRFFPACSIGHPQRGSLQPPSPSPPKSALNSRRLRAPRPTQFDSRG
jgi:hypothetical protein